jgi:eukaryotic-like serine/threonine-protein kinase
MTTAVRTPCLTRGDRVGGWVVREPLGTGGEATVYRVRHHDTGTPAALKVHERTKNTTPARGRLGHEALMLARIRSARIPRVLELQTDAATPYLAMTLAGHESLAERLRDTGPLGVAETAALVSVVAAALQSVHNAGVLHMDVTPANIVMGGSPTVQLIDFGAARSVDGWSPLAGPGSYDGTVGYVAPERCLGAEPHAAMDVFSLAAVAYRALIGVRPYVDTRTYTAPDPGDYGKHLVSPFALRPEMGPEMAYVLSRSLSMDPSERAASPIDFAIQMADAVPSTPSVHHAAARARVRQGSGLGA